MTGGSGTIFPAAWDRFQLVGDGRHLLVFPHFGFRGAERVDVVETSTAVTISLYHRVPDGLYIRHDVFPDPIQVSLANALGDRAVYDGKGNQQRHTVLPGS